MSAADWAKGPPKDSPFATYGEENLADYIARQIENRQHTTTPMAFHADTWKAIVKALRQAETVPLGSWKAEERLWHEMNDRLRTALSKIANHEFQTDKEALTMRQIAADALAGVSVPSETRQSDLADIEEALWALLNYESNRDDAGRVYSEVDITRMVSAIRAFTPSATPCSGPYTLPSTEEVERTMKDAARYRRLKDAAGRTWDKLAGDHITGQLDKAIDGLGDEE